MSEPVENTEESPLSSWLSEWPFIFIRHSVNVCLWELAFNWSSRPYWPQKHVRIPFPFSFWQLSHFSPPNQFNFLDAFVVFFSLSLNSILFFRLPESVSRKRNENDTHARTVRQLDDLWSGNCSKKLNHKKFMAMPADALLIIECFFSFSYCKRVKCTLHSFLCEWVELNCAEVIYL